MRSDALAHMRGPLEETAKNRSSRPDNSTDQPLPHERLMLAALIGLALAVRIPGLTESLWYDELWSTRIKLGSVGDLFRTMLYDIHPPLYSVLDFLWSHVFGDSELSVRAIPLLAGLATIALLPSLGAVLATRRAGWIAAFMLALSPVHIWYAQEARAYSLLMLVCVLLPLAYHGLDDEHRRWRKTAFILLNIAVAQLHYFAIVFPAAFVFLSFVRRKHQRTSLAALLLSSTSLALVIGIKWSLGELETASSYLSAFHLPEIPGLFIRWFLLAGSVSAGVRVAPAIVVIAWLMVAAAIAAVCIFAARALRPPRSARTLELVLVMSAVPALLLLLGLLGRDNYYIERSALPSLPFFFLVVGAGIDTLTRRALQAAFACAVFLGLAGVLAAFYQQGDTRTVYKPNADWRGAAEHLQLDVNRRNAPVVVLATTPLTELRYYGSAAAACLWPTRGADQRAPAQSGVSGLLARQFPPSPQPGCGPGGTATIRTYFSDAAAQRASGIIAYEKDANPVVAINAYWSGKTQVLLNNLIATGGFLVQRRERVKGVEIVYLTRR